MKAGELVTAQIFSMWAFEMANPDLSLDEMKKAKLDPAKQISSYVLGDLEPEKTAVAFMKAKFTDGLAEIDIRKAEECNIKKLDDASELQFKSSISTEKLKGKEATNEHLKHRNQVCIIGFWRKDHNDEFHCYNFFYVPNPIVR